MFEVGLELAEGGGEQAALGPALDEAGQRDDEVDLEVVGHGGAVGVAVDRRQLVVAVELAGDVAGDQAPGEDLGRPAVVVAEAVAGAAAHGRGPEGDLQRPALGVPGDDLGGLQVVRPHGVVLEVGEDLPGPLGRRADHHVLRRLVSHVVGPLTCRGWTSARYCAGGGASSGAPSPVGSPASSSVSPVSAVGAPAVVAPAAASARGGKAPW